MTSQKLMNSILALATYVKVRIFLILINNVFLSLSVLTKVILLKIVARDNQTTNRPLFNYTISTTMPINFQLNT